MINTEYYEQIHECLNKYLLIPPELVDEVKEMWTNARNEVERKMAVTNILSGGLMAMSSLEIATPREIKRELVRDYGIIVPNSWLEAEE